MEARRESARARASDCIVAVGSDLYGGCGGELELGASQMVS